MKGVDIVVILCEPQGPKNVGAVCRAMKNMNLSNLRIVSQKFSDNSIEEVYTAALSSRDIYDGAERYQSLEEALADVSLSFGFTARKGKYRKFFAFTPREVAEKISGFSSGLVALVFGNETRGLTNSQLQLCSAAAYIPASLQYPSLNLSHAVQIAAYEIFLRLYFDSVQSDSGADNLVPNRYRPISQRALDSLVGELMKTLDSFYYFEKASPIETKTILRDILGRSGICDREYRVLEKMFRKLRYLPRKDWE